MSLAELKYLSGFELATYNGVFSYDISHIEEQTSGSDVILYQFYMYDSKQHLTRGVRHSQKSRTPCLKSISKSEIIINKRLINYILIDKRLNEHFGQISIDFWSLEITEIKFEIRNQLEIKLISKSRTRFQQVSDPST